MLKGTTTGTVTDMDGNYTIDVEGDGTLVFSYVSMKTVEESINGRSTINVEMSSDSEALEEVVVTAMGIKRESKTLTYSAQTVGGKDLNEIKNVNMINSLIGVVKEKMCANIRNGDVFIFIGHSRRLMKLLLLRTNTILRAICNVTVFRAIQPCISLALA